ncbi:hypothetical protein NUACC21_62920 [Scytonema sp. NUACC21]
MGAESSLINPNVQIQGATGDSISGGAQRGSNLFHSFSQFNVSDGQRVYFVNPIGVKNILTRVTGEQGSNIFGTLGVEGSANLFLLNPNGILFGPNARLDVGGSFVGTTANTFRFGEQGVFSATNPEAPPLLTVNPSAFLFNQLNPKAITNQSVASAGVNPAGENVTGLRVPDGKSLLLVGGNINIDGGSLRTYGGRIELAGLAAPGAIGLNLTDNILSLGVNNEAPRADISLTNAAEVNVRGADGGSIAINAQNLTLGGESKVRAGIDRGLGTPQSKAGDININATGTTTLTNTSFIANVPQPTSIGNSGNINITTGSLTLLDGSALNTNNFGQGDGGNVNLNIRDRLTIAGVDRDGLGSAILSGVQSEALGNGGNINIAAGSVSLTDGAFLDASISGRGSAGSIFIRARDSILLSNSYIYSNVESGGIGNVGNINVAAFSLTLKDGTQLQTLLRSGNSDLPAGRGVTGNINIDVLGQVNITGQKNGFSSGFFSSVGTGAVGNSGNINIRAGSLSLIDNAIVRADNSGQGNAGNISVQVVDSVSLQNSSIYSSVGISSVGNGGDIDIQAKSVSLIQGSELNSQVQGQGNAGNINIKASETIALDGRHNEIFSRIISAFGSTGEGQAGDIAISTGSLRVTNGAFISSSTSGRGNAGNMTIDARDAIAFDSGSYASSSVFPSGRGIGGNIQITTGALLLTNGGNISANVAGLGDAGNITINARDTVKLDGIDNIAIGGIQSRFLTTGIGNGGEIRLTTGSLFVTNGAQINADTFGQGNGGNITINAQDTVLFEGTGKSHLATREENSFSSAASSTVGGSGVGKGGNLRINAKALFLRNGGLLNANSFGRGDGGDITIDVSDTISFDGVGSNDLQSGATSIGNQGNGGDIQLTTGGTLSLTNGGTLSSFGQANAGNITINARDVVNFDGVSSNGLPSGARSFLSAGGSTGRGGNIGIKTGSLFVTNGAQINVGTLGQGNGGDIIIDARDAIRFDGIGNSKQFSGAYSTVESTGVGNAGNIQLTTDSLSLSNGALVTVSSLGKGNAGNLSIVARKVNVTDRSVATVSNLGVGDAGNLEMRAFAINLSDGGTLTAESVSGRGGDIRLEAGNLLLLRRNSKISAISGTTQTAGLDGNININTQFLVALPSENSDIVATGFGRSPGSNIRINARGIFGTQFRQQPTPESDIVATGDVALNVLDVDPKLELVELPVNLVDASTQIDTRCSLGSKQIAGSFTVTGRGSFPPNPLEPLAGKADLNVLATLDSESSTFGVTGEGDKEIGGQQDPENEEIIEASSWVKTADGNIVLVASVPQAARSVSITPGVCSVSQ